ncbi:MAG: hypothetical protein WC745_00755 [Patescibacteria group bacterium]|jgi:3D (Asp-Asp-Asp) domain-containing protein
MDLNKNKNKISQFFAYLSRKTAKHRTPILSFLMIVLVFDYFLFPLPALAQAEADSSANGAITELVDSVNQNSAAEDKNIAPLANLPKNTDALPVIIKVVQITAYNSEIGQCDGDPCTTANGFNVCTHGIEDTVAANSLPFGTKIRIPELFGDRIFIVRDRMNSRYRDRVDVWMLNHKDAVKFGLKTAKIEILK